MPLACGLVCVGGSQKVTHLKMVVVIGKTTVPYCDLCSGNGLDFRFSGGSREFHAPVQSIVIR